MTRKVRLGFIGAGWWATANNMPMLQARDDVSFVAVCDRQREAAVRAQRRFGFTYATTDSSELFDYSLDAVVVTTPHAFHYAYAKAALDTGLHVLVEKPMTLHATEAWDLVRIARERNLHLMVPFGWHYNPMVLALKEQMGGEVIGQVEYVLCHMASGMRAQYAGEALPYSFGDAPAPGRETYSDPRLAGGGQGQSQLSHAIALMLWLTGLRASEVFAYMSSPNSQVDLYDALTVRFAGGAIGLVSGAGTLPPSIPRQQLDVRIFGSKGVLLLDLERERAEVVCDDGRHFRFPAAEGAGRYSCDGPPHRFVDLILGQAQENLSPGEVAARSVELLDAAYRSVVSGRPETISQG